MVNEIQCSNSNKGGALFTRVLCQKSKLWRWLHMATTLSSLQHSSVLDPSPIHYVRATLPAKSTSCSITSLTYKLATYPDTQRSDWKRINYRITYNLQLTVIMKYFCQTLTDVLETTDTNSTVQAVVKVPLDAAEQEHLQLLRSSVHTSHQISQKRSGAHNHLLGLKADIQFPSSNFPL